MTHPTYRRIYAVVARIPAGRVATYGQVAALAGLPGRARQVGYALHALPEGTSLPWHRVINARGEVSPRSEPDWPTGGGKGAAPPTHQRFLLEEEGVPFDAAGRVDLDLFRWDPDAAAGQRPRPRSSERGLAAGRRNTRRRR